MNEKEKIKNAPFLVHINAYRHYNVTRNKLIIEIDILGEKENLILFSHGISIGKLGKRLYDYDERGRDFFNNLISKFGKVYIKLSKGKEIIKIDFDSYEDFLDEITSD